MTDFPKVDLPKKHDSDQKLSLNIVYNKKEEYFIGQVAWDIDGKKDFGYAMNTDFYKLKDALCKILSELNGQQDEGDW